MAHNVVTASQFATQLALSATGTVLSVGTVAAQASGTSIHVQLNQTHAFMYLDIPLWWFFAASIALSFIGAFLALLTDTLRGKGSLAGKFITSVLVGLIATFIFLPAATDKPNVVVMMLISLGGSFSGTILLFLVAKLITDAELHDAIVDVTKVKLLAAWSLATSLIPGGKK